MYFRSFAFAAAAIALATSGPAFARAKLMVSAPAASSSVSSVRALSLTFSEAIDSKLSGVDIVMTAMRGMMHDKPMKIAGFKTEMTADGKTMKVVLPRALPAGTYQVSWHAVGADKQMAEGKYTFTAR